MTLFGPNETNDWKTNYPDDLVEPEFTVVHIFADDIFVLMKSLVVAVNADNGGIFDTTCGPSMRRVWDWLESTAESHSIVRPDGWHKLDKLIPACPAICSCGHLKDDHVDGKCTREDDSPYGKPEDCDCDFFSQEYPE